MRRWLALLLLLPGLAVAQGLPRPVRDALRAAHVPADAVAVVVQEVDAPHPVVAHRAAAPMNPASVMKVVTSLAALDLLGPAFRFHTDIFANGELHDGVLRGDLVIRGGGDPKLTYDALWKLAHQLRARGLREIRGDVILDRSYFAPVPADAGRFDGEPRRAYNVAPDALLVNYQAVDFRFVPDGDRVRVIAEPDFPNLQVASRLKVVSAPCTSWRRDVLYDVEDQGAASSVAFSGTYPAECGERTLPLALFDPERYFESAFRWVWGEAGGKLTGGFRMAPTPASAWLLYRHESEPLALLVRDMNKYSNNVMARHLFLALSAEQGGPGEPRASERIVREWLHEQHIDDAALVLENGSGLSRDERASALLLARVLAAAWHSPVMPELAASFPLVGVDGTLKSHPRAAQGGAHLKGGTLTGVQSAAGYVLDRAGHRWIVVMLMNHANANAAGAAVDALIDWVASGRPR
ncbi:MAG TPA: D-alanyl-D-alanine carboxypeptidase/D-alanyl-D-alanine-endopeptidase [Usitatibacter sp.]|jgi:D-alanyl-D-alanine carboxypeptidase/D-alanyl-D-alanine-endopeptidase (penicillin-binding protein 4)|nr:D-alanyl-D-alanine carboxypeptidase/D-alanyl-D-alanine-endopeptidase [Usitatibacter sp.]